MRLVLVALGIGVLCPGCTTESLQRYTANQAASTVDYRYTAALNCLATVADNAGALPSMAIQLNGSARVQDMQSANATLTIMRAFGTFYSEMLMLSTSRSPNEQWTINPVADFSQIAALHATCLWMIYGPEFADTPEYPGILNSPIEDPRPGPHFGVADRLRKIPPRWLCIGLVKDIPPTARYKGHSGNTWVWVNSEGVEALSEFTLALLDIATINVGPSTQSPPLLVSLYRYPTCYTLPSKPGPDDKSSPWGRFDVFADIEKNKEKIDKKIPPIPEAVNADQLPPKSTGPSRPDSQKSDENKANSVRRIFARELGDKRFVSAEDFLAAVKSIAKTGGDDFIQGDAEIKKIVEKNGSVLLAGVKKDTNSVFFTDVRSINKDPQVLLNIQSHVSLCGPAPDPTSIDYGTWIDSYTQSYHSTRANVKPTGAGGATPQTGQTPQQPERSLPGFGPPLPSAGVIRGIIEPPSSQSTK